MAKKEGAEQKANLYLLAIVAIVAVVGIVVLVLNSGGVSVSTDDLTGQAYEFSGVSATDDSGNSEPSATGKKCCKWKKNQHGVVKCRCWTTSSECVSNCGT